MAEEADVFGGAMCGLHSLVREKGGDRADTTVTFDAFEEAVWADAELLGVTQGMVEELPEDPAPEVFGIEVAFMSTVDKSTA